MYRAAKNDNGTIICTSHDEGQSGNYPTGSSNEERLGVWCDWTFEEVPTFVSVEGCEVQAPNRFKENVAEDGIELRSDEDVLESPQG